MPMVGNNLIIGESTADDEINYSIIEQQDPQQLVLSGHMKLSQRSQRDFILSMRAPEIW